MQLHQLRYLPHMYTRPYRLIRHFPIANFDPRECERDLFIAKVNGRRERKYQ